MSETELMREVVRRTLTVMPDVQKIVLFGSRARSDHRADSDVDLLIIKRNLPPVGTRSVALRLALRGLGVGFDLVVVTPEEWGQMRNLRGTIGEAADQDGRVLHEAA